MDDVTPANNKAINIGQLQHLFDSFGVKYHTIPYNKDSGIDGNIVVVECSNQRYFHSFGFDPNGQFISDWLGDNFDDPDREVENARNE